jgi:hypothetical protein
VVTPAFHVDHPSTRVDADLISTTGVASNTYTKIYVEVAHAAGRGCLTRSGKLAPLVS